MQPYQDAIGEMIDAFARLPGISRRGAERLTYHLLQQPEEVSDTLANAIAHGRHSIHYCKRCFNLTDEELCPICKSSKRDKHRVCVVEEARDIIAIEHSGAWKGLYHVLGGVISPMDGVGPDQLHIKELLARIDEEGIEEIILALNASVEGEATTLYLISQLHTKDVKVSRIAQGLSAGSDIKYADQMTLSRAIEGRTEINHWTKEELNVTLNNVTIIMYSIEVLVRVLSRMWRNRQTRTFQVRMPQGVWVQVPPSAASADQMVSAFLCAQILFTKNH